MTVVARNHRTATGSGEVDLVAWDGPTLVFVEVKSRATEEYGAPDRAIDDEKRRRLTRAAGDYLRRSGLPSPAVRFDVVNVILSDPPEITHLRDAFSTNSVDCLH
jgi:putative endonuclease